MFKNIIKKIFKIIFIYPINYLKIYKKDICLFHLLQNDVFFLHLLQNDVFFLHLLQNDVFFLDIY